MVQWSAVGPSLAIPVGEPGAAAGFLLAQLARKGTRNYIPDTYSERALEDPSPVSEAKALEDCMATWDEGTHISKSSWREICHRQIKERGAQLSGH
jgi:hypothetical protein